MNEEEKILPSKSIGKYYIGMPFGELKKIIPDYKIKSDYDESFSIIFEPYFIVIDKKNNTIKQIDVGKPFNGKFLNKIGIGSTLKYVREVAGEYYEPFDGKGDFYILKDYPGIAFVHLDDDELDDELIKELDENYDEEKVPIGYISVFDPKILD